MNRNNLIHFLFYLYYNCFKKVRDIMRILIVEDEFNLADAISTKLKKKNIVLIFQRMGKKDFIMP